VFEYLELAVRKSETLLAGVRNAKVVFSGCYAPGVIGSCIDVSGYGLPAACSARFFSLFSVPDYMKYISILKLWAEQLSRPPRGCANRIGTGGRVGSAQPLCCCVA